MEFGKKMQNKGYYADQGHSRSSRSVQTVCDFLLVINSNGHPILHPTVSELSQLIVQILDTVRF